MADFRKKEQKDKNKKSFSSVVLIVLIVLASLAIILVTVGIVYVRSLIDYNYNEITTDNLGATETINDNTINIALFGVDSREENSFKGLSDSIIILSFSTETKKIKLISVMRDSFVPIEKESGVVYSKINSAYSSGGPELAIKTLNNIFALDITDYATVNFGGMADIIDAVGGVEVTVTEEELKSLNSYLGQEADKYGGEPADYNIEAGTQTLNGMKAVVYSRIRNTANSEGTRDDYGRTDRQRIILEQLIKKATTMNKTRYIELIGALGSCCESSLTKGEILDMATKVLLNKPTFAQGRVPSIEYTMSAPQTNAGSVVYYDLEYAANIIHSFIYDDVDPSDYIKQNEIQKNDWYKTGYKPPVIKNKENTSSNSSTASK